MMRAEPSGSAGISSSAAAPALSAAVVGGFFQREARHRESLTRDDRPEQLVAGRRCRGRRVVIDGFRRTERQEIRSHRGADLVDAASMESVQAYSIDAAGQSSCNKNTQLARHNGGMRRLMQSGRQLRRE